jgi:hypothetical protein
MRKVIFRIFTVLIVLGLVVILYYLPLYYWIIKNKEFPSNPSLDYQFSGLELSYTSSFVTLLAVVVALLKDELKWWLWAKRKISVKQKSQNYLSEKISSTSIEDVRAEMYEVVIYVINTGSLHIDKCHVSLSELQYLDANNYATEVDFISQNLHWYSKKDAVIPLHSKGKGEISLIQIKSNDAGTVGEGQSQSPKLFIGEVETEMPKDNIPLTGIIKWIATFMIYYDTHSPIEYKIEIGWDGKWQNRLTEMKKHVTIKILSKK